MVAAVLAAGLPFARHAAAIDVPIRLYLPTIVYSNPTLASGSLFVALDGNDRWSGRLARPNSGRTNGPFRSIQHAVDSATPGDTIVVEPGEYREQVIIRKSGKPGAPISLVGEHGAVIDGGVRVSGWTAAPEIGAGVYKNRLSFNPENMTWNDKYRVRLKDSRWGDGSARDIIANGPDGTWAYSGALYGVNDGTTYVKLEGGLNPNSQNVTFTKRWSGPIVVHGANYITIRGLELKNGYNAVLLTQNAGNIVLEDNLFIGGRMTIGITFGAHDISVRRNTITLGFPVDVSPFGPQGAAIWRLFRGISGDARYGIGAYQGGDNLEIAGNHFTQHFVAIGYEYGVSRDKLAGVSRNWNIHDNLIDHMNHVGIAVGGGAVNQQIHDNRVWNCLQPLRFQDPTSGPVYVYRNMFATGTSDYANLDNLPELFYNYRPTLARILVYHNSFSGVKTAAFSAGNDPNIDAPSITASPNMYWFNNIFSAKSSGLLPVGAQFGYNLMPALANPGGTNVTGVALWPDSDTELRLASNSPARAIGVDVSRSFTINGKTFGAMPGFTPGYFRGARPDIGAYQFGE